MERFCLGFLGTIFGVVAAVGLIAPQLIFDPIGVSLDDIAGRAEIRAAYAGLFGTVSGILVMGVMKESQRTLALAVATSALATFTFARLLSWAIDGTPENPLAIGNLVVEGVGAIVMGALWIRRRRASS